MNVHCRIGSNLAAKVLRVNKVIALLFLTVIGLCCKSSAADLVVSNNAIINIFGDSFMVDSTSISVGYRFPDYLESYFQLNYPKANIHVFNISRSGGTMDDRLTNSIQKNGLALWAYQFNNFQHIGISSSTDNGGLTSNQMYLSQSNCFLAPALMSDGDFNMVAHSGWSAAHPVQWIGLGHPPASTNGSLPMMQLNDAGTNAGWTLGARGVDWWHTLVQGETNDALYNGGLSAGWQKGGHPGAGLQLAMTMTFLKQITTDTNISTAVVDWNSSTPVSANHCVISSISRNGNTLTFNRQDDRLPFAWDMNPLMGITNDCMQAFVLNPSDGNFFQFNIAVQNIPAGTYSVLIDGQFVGAISSGDLANGWNMFTNTVGPYWAQRTEVLGRIRDKEHVDRYSRLPGSAGDAQGMVSYDSFANMYWTNNANRGDTLINTLSNRVANMMAWDALTVQAAQPTNHTFTIFPYAPTAIVKISAPTNAFNTPVILDGSSSIKATSYYWEQVSGLPQLDMIGQGTSKPMLISVTNAGTYTFRLTVSDGQTSSSSLVNVTFIQPAGRTLFVDNQLTANCLNNNYSIANRNGSGADGLAYTNLQSAANATRPGDVVYIRGGLYTNAVTAIANQNLVMVTNAGTATAPIRYENYNNEHVTLAGWGYSDIDTNGDGLADGPNFPAYRQKLFFVQTNANFTQVKGLELTNSQQDGIIVEASFCYVQECSAHDNWMNGAGVTRMKDPTNLLCGTVFRWVEAYHNRHFTGICIGLFDQSTFGFVSDCAIVDCISDWNGYQNDGREVMPIGGDPEGGGNAGGFWSTKYFADNAFYFPQYGVHNWGTNIYFVRNISFNNCDDGLAFDHGNSVIEGNESLFNGPTGAEGYKFLRFLQGMIVRGNIAYGNQARGFEIRVDTNTFALLVNNTSVKNNEYGIWYAGMNSTGLIYATNNVFAYNGQTDFTVTSIPTSVPNWSADGLNVGAAYHGDPMLLNTNITLNYAFPPGYTVRQKHDSLDRQIRGALSPAAGSPLLASGIVVQGYQMPFADNDPNNPMSLTAPGRHWKVPAPNMGAFDLFTSAGTKPAPPTNLRSVTNSP